MKRNFLIFLLISVFLVVFPSSFVKAINILTVGTDAVVYKVGENITVSGHIYSTTGLPIPGAPLSLQKVSGPSSLPSLSTTSNPDGSYRFTPFTLSTPGNYTIKVIQTNSPNTYVMGSFSVIQKKILYTVSTDKFIYQRYENVTVTITARDEDGKAVSTKVLLKIKLENGTVVKETSLQTGSNGIATFVYNVTNYGKYVVVIGNSLAIDKFEVPPFEVKLDTQTPEGKSKFQFSSDDSLVIQAIVRVKSGESYLPVKGASVSAVIKDYSGVAKLNLPSANFSEVSDGVYQSSPISLKGFTGKYYVEVKVVKSSVSQQRKIDFSVQNYRLDIIPFSKFEHVFGFLRGSEGYLGLIIQDLKTGSEITEDKVESAVIEDCRTEEWKTCKISASLQPGFRDFVRVIKFIAPDKNGQYYLKVRATIKTEKGSVNVTGDTWISVQDVLAFVETLDEFGSWRWRYSPGETIVLRIKALGKNWIDATPNISKVEVEEIRDDDWDDVTSYFSKEVKGNEVSLTWNSEETQGTGWYTVKLKITMKDESVAFAGAGFRVSLYDVWAEVKDENGNWEWKFEPNSDVFLHVNVRKLDGSILPINKIAKVSILKLINEVTGKIYTNPKFEMNGTAKNWEGEDVPVVKLSLAGMGLTTGFYSVEIEITDVEGNKERGGTGFKISNLDVWISTRRGTEWAWQFAPTDNITFEVNARYFNGTPVPDGSNVMIEKLFLMRDGPPVAIPDEKYSTSIVTQTQSGMAYAWLKPEEDPLPEGFYMVMIKVVTNESNSKEELAEGWFEVRSMRVELSTEQWAFSPDKNVTIHVIVRKADNTPIEGANVSLAGLRYAVTWQEVDLDAVGINESCKIKGVTDSSGKFNITFPASKLGTGDYEARIMASSDALKAKSESFIWFSIRDYSLSGWFITDPGREWGIYGPDEEVKMHIEVFYPNGSYAANKEVSVYQLINTETWPWTPKNASMVSSVEVSNGTYEIRFKAPKEAGRYNPLLNISGTLMKSPWDLPSFEVRDLDVSLRLFNNQGNPTEEFKPGEDVTVNIEIKNPTGGSLPNITEIRIEKYRDLETREETEVGARKTTNIEESNNLTFQAPTEEGEYILVVSVETPSRTIYAEKWFRVSSFELEFWTDRWSYLKGENVTIYMRVRYPDGNDAIVNVTQESIRNVFTGEERNLSSTPKRAEISGYGIYNYTIPSNEIVGEYELELCVFVGSSCQPTSRRIYVHFAIEPSSKVDAWPEKGGSFTPSENATFYLEVWDADHQYRFSPNDYNVTLESLKDARTWKDLTSLISNTITFIKDTTENRTKITFPLSGFEEGEYELTVNVSKDTDWNLWRLWFRVDNFTIILRPLQGDFEFDVGENITFNITVIGTPPVNNGTLRIQDNLKGWIDIITKEFELSNNQALVNVSLDEVSEYTAIARVGGAEEYYWFRTTAFGIDIKHHVSTHDIKPGDNVTIVFNVFNKTGEHSGTVKINVTRIKDARTWNDVAAPNIFIQKNADVEKDENFTFNPNATGSLGIGEYEAEIVFSIDVGGGNWVEQREYFWFQYRTLDFWAWPPKPNYLPGDEITIMVNLRDPTTRNPISGRNITIVKVYSRTRGELSENYILEKNSSITNDQGEAVLKLRLSPEITGWVDVELEENETHQKTWAGFNINGYNVNFERNWEKWAFATTENYTAHLYVYFINGTPAPGRNVRVLAYKEGKDPYDPDIQPDLNETMSPTNASGYTLIRFNCSNLMGGVGKYWIIVKIDENAAKVDDWIKVESFHVDAWTEGMQTGMSEVAPGETVRVMVRVESLEGTPIPGANVSIIQIRKLPEWVDILQKGTGFNVTMEKGVTDSLGFVELGLIAPQDEHEYLVELNVSHSSYGENIGEAWFRVTSTIVNWEFMCWNGTHVIKCPGDPHQKFPGDWIALVVNTTGDQPRKVKVVPFEFKDLWRGIRTVMNMTPFEDENATVAYIQVPENFEEGDYELAFYVWVNSTGDYEFKGEYRAWFKVLSSTGFIFDRFVEPHNAWAGRNATIWIDVRNITTWDHVVCNISEEKPIRELRNAWNWVMIANATTIIQEVVNEVEGGKQGPGPQGSKIIFTVPNDVVPGEEYLARLNFTCSNLPNVSFTGDAWFRVAAFQVSSLMPTVVKPNQTVEYWIKVTDANGNPVVNATVCQDELDKEPGMVLIKEWQNCIENDTTNENGEVTHTLPAPGFAGDFMLRLRVINGSKVQKVERWFTIKGIKLKIELPKDLFFNDEDVQFNVSVKDAMTDQPLPNVTVRVDVFPIDEENKAEPIHFENDTSAEGKVQIFVPNSSTSSSDYMIHAEACTDKGWDFVEKAFAVRNFNTTIVIGKEYYPGDKVIIKIHSENSTGYNLVGATVRAQLYNVSEMGEPGNVSLPNSTTLDSNGNGTIILTISDKHSGMTTAMIEINSSDKIDREAYILVTHDSTLDINVSIPQETFSPNQLIDVNISCNNPNLAVAPPLPTMEKVGESIPLSQIMTMGKEEAFLESPVFLDPNGKAHMKILAPSHPGKYTTLLLFIIKDSEWFGPEDMEDVMFVEYEVVE